MLAMIAYPEVQKKCQEELDSVVGRSRMPTLKDRENLPYLRATVRELFRWRTPVPIGELLPNLNLFITIPTTRVRRTALYNGGSFLSFLFADFPDTYLTLPKTFRMTGMTEFSSRREQCVLPIYGIMSHIIFSDKRI